MDEGDGVATATGGSAAGWYQDPDDSGRLRWWNGHTWTSDVSAHTPVTATAARHEVPQPMAPPAGTAPTDATPDGPAAWAWPLAIVAVVAAVVAVAAVVITTAGHSASRRVAGSSGTSAATAPVSTPAGSAQTPASPTELLAQATSDAQAQGWVHIEVSSSAPGHSELFVQDSGPTSGHQVITADGAHAEVILVDGVAYTRGDQAAVTSFFGYPASQGPRLANQWISYQQSDSDYSTVTDGVTISSALSDLGKLTSVTETPGTSVGGAPATALTSPYPPSGGDPGGTVTLWVTTGPHPLPIRLDADGTDGSKTIMRFSAWATPAPLAAPPNAIPASSIPTS